MSPSAALAEEYRYIRVEPLTGVIGAEIHGVDLGRPLASAVAEEVLAAFARHQVIVLPDQDIPHAAHREFASLFGPVVRVPQLHAIDGHPDVQIIRRRATDTGRVVGENWHADSTFLEEPPAAVVMRAIDVPPYGGDTGFLSMYAAYEALSPVFRDMVERLDIVHSATRIFGSAYRAQQKRFDAASTRADLDVAEGDRETLHPLVARHPRSGRRHLFVNRTYAQRIDGLNEPESAALLALLYEHCARYDLTCRVRWRPNQLLVWDNRCTMHRAVADYAGFDRMLVRVTVGGERPVR